MKKIFFLLFISIFLINIRADSQTMSEYTATPPFLSKSVPPLVMMVMGRDHKLYYEAYNDASDLDDDGELDVGYKHSIDYYGYFDPYKCYSYDTTGTPKFAPSNTTTDKYCSGKWSGNFLNWVTTSRIDALRKVFYGGKRSTDSSSETVLVGGYIPQDAHSWGKEFTGSDTPKLTPYTDPSGGGTLPTSAVPWDQTQKILMVTYDDTTSGVSGSDHTNLVNSYSLCYYSSYSYISNLDENSIIDPDTNHIDTGNFFLVSEFYVSASQDGIDQNGLWAFAVDSDDGAEVEIYDQTAVSSVGIASYYGAHGECGDTDACRNSHSTTITLNSGRYYRMIVRQRENTGGDGVKVWYKVDTDDDGSISDETWYIFGSVGANPSKKYYITYRAPNVSSTETVRFMHSNFINTGEPAYDASGATTITCNTGRHLFCVTSLSNGADPVMRVLQNKSNRIWEWASTERAVCSGPETPTDYNHSLGTPTDYYVRVKVCDSSIGLESNCKEYPNSPPSKPTGLFQKYGESTETVCSKSFNSCNTDSDCGGSPEVCIDKGKIFFGLMTGSYTKNLSGGVLRWNIDAITHAVDNRNVGIIKTSSSNMLTNFDKIKIKGFTYSDYSYQDTGANCGWISTRPITEGECRMWGNPIAEMMYEATRYFAGKTDPTSEYSAGTGNTGTDDAVLGLTNQSDTSTGGGAADQDDWIPPYNKYPSCSKPFIITLSDVSPSYDSDQLPGADGSFGTFTGDITGLDVKSLSDTIGTTEGINGTDVFIGQSGTVLDYMCSSKAVSALGSIRGLCPEEPTKKGSYYSAAVAYYGKTLFNTNYDKPNITTYSVALESPVPEIKVSVAGKTVKIIPVGKSVSGCLSVNSYCASKCTLTYDASTGKTTISNCSSDANCPSNQIVDFYIDTLTSTYGGFRVNFEDVEQGADHDMDAIVQYSYEVNADNTVTIGLNSSYAAGCIDQVMGFVVQGTTEDGVYLPVRDADSGTSDGDTPSTVSGMPTTWSHTFTPSTAGSTTTLLKNPLWYAAKWGGFEDKNGDDKPDQSSEWDEDGDGVPDTYFPVTNPLKMEEQLTQVFNDILRRVGSATSISVLSTSASGAGNVFQAYFLPAQTVDNEDITWLGHLLQLGVSEKGELLDKNGNTLTFSFDETEGQTYINVGGSKYALTEWMGYKWDAADKLITKTSSSRTIKTFIDADNDGVVDSGEFVSFEDGNKTTLKPYLRAVDDTESANIINFIRGSEISGYRNRTYSDGNQYKLGDIIYSTPTVVTSPAENYSLLYGDETYQTFFDANKGRDTVVYIGANDGMLHAICAKTGGCTGSIAEGEELWSYIPQNLLPHLKWLKDPDYSHVYYVDLRAKITDINFSNMGTNGWKTVLIGGMRLGGGQISVTADFGSGSQTRKFQSSYFAIDITDPHNPSLLWEWTLSDATASLGFTASYPTIAKVGNKWFVVIGSGPKSLYTPDYTGASTQTGKIFILDARNTTGAWTLNSTYWKFDTSVSNGFMGDPLAVDIDFEPDNTATDSSTTFNSEVVYIGMTYDSSGTPKWRGKLFRLVLNGDVDPANWNLYTLFDGNAFTTATPITISPVATKDELDNLWVYFGTGRFYSDTDKATTTAHTFIGIRDSYWYSSGEQSKWKPCWNGSSWSTNTQCTTSGITGTSALYNSGNVTKVTEGGSSGTVVTTGSGDLSWDDFVESVSEDANIRGWYADLSAGTTDAGAERVITKPTVIGGNVLFTTFIPKTDLCQYCGTSNLYSLYYKAGTAYKESTLEAPPASGTTGEVKKSISLGYGMASAPALHIGQQEGGKATVFIQDSTGRINTIEYQLSLPRSGVISWKEL